MKHIKHYGGMNQYYDEHVCGQCRWADTCRTRRGKNVAVKARDCPKYRRGIEAHQEALAQERVQQIINSTSVTNPHNYDNDLIDWEAHTTHDVSVEESFASEAEWEVMEYLEGTH